MLKPMAFTLSLFFTSISFGQSLTLQEALNIAKENNSVIRQLRLKYDSAEWGRIKAMSTYLPKLSLRGQHLLDDKFQVEPVNFSGSTIPFAVALPYTEFDLRAEYTLFEGFAGVNQYEADRMQEKASELELARAEFQLERDVRARFYQALGAQILQVVAEQRVKNLTEHLNTSKRFVQNGVTTNYDVLRIDVQLADAKNDQLQAEDNVVLAKNRLAQVLGQSAVTQSLAGDFPSIEKIMIPEDFAPSDKQRDDIQAKLLKEESAHKMSQAAKAWWSPKVNVYAEKQYYDYTDRDWQYSDHYNDAYFVGLTLNWEFFDGGVALANQKQAANQAAIEAETAREALLELPQEFDLWKRKYQRSVLIYRSNSLSITKAQEAVRQATNGRKAGTRTINDVLDSELELNQTKAKMVQAQIDAIEALGNLELASGKKLYDLTAN